ncbi:FtsX-like permease family protein [Aeromonas sp. R6-2]|uniref:FtsX-like permease family protein n=1 Tax=Aeromonas sp. R6-2 TaxID=3138472 RepID=UPI0034A4746A
MSLALRSLLRLYRTHPWLLLMSLFGLILGAALVVAIDLINHSARTNFVAARTQIEGEANWRLAPEGGIDERRFVTWATSLPGLDAAPQIHAWLRDETGQPFQLIGIDPLFGGPLRRLIQSGAPEPASEDEQAVWIARKEAARLDWQLGQPRTFLLAERRLTLRLAGLLEEGEIPLDHLLVTDIGLAQQWLGREGRIDRVYFRLDEAGVKALTARLAPGEALERTGPELDASRLGDALALNLTALSLLALAVGLFLVFNAQRFVLSVRRPHLARLITVGLGPTRLLRLLATELLLITLTGALLGMMLGVALAAALMGQVGQALGDLYGPNPIHLLRLTPLTFIKTLLLCLAGVVAANLPAWYGLLRRPLRELELPGPGMSRPRLRRWMALMLLGLGGVLLGWQASGLPGALLLSACWLLSMALWLPDLLTPLLGRLRHLRRREQSKNGHRGGPWLLRLAMSDLDFERERNTVAVMALQLAIAAAIGIGVMVASFRLSVEGWLVQRLAADLYVTAPRAPQGGYASLPPTLIPWLEAQGSLQLSRRRVDSALLGDQAIELASMEMIPPLMRGYPLLAGRLPGPGEALASEPLLRRFDLKVGDRVHIEGPFGRLTLRLCGSYRDYGSDKGQLLRPWQTTLNPHSLALFAPPPGLEAELAARFGDRVRLLPARGILTQALAIFDQTFVVTELLKLLILAIAFAGVAIAFMVQGLARAPWQQTLHALGLARGELLRLQLWQGGVLGLLTALLALPVGYGLAWILIEVVNPRAFGWSLAFTPAPAHAALTLLLAPLSALAASALAWHLTRRAS